MQGLLDRPSWMIYPAELITCLKASKRVFETYEA